MLMGIFIFFNPYYYEHYMVKALHKFRVGQVLWANKKEPFECVNGMELKLRTGMRTRNWDSKNAEFRQFYSSTCWCRILEDKDEHVYYMTGQTQV